MTIAQCKAARNRMKNDGRYKPKKGLRQGIKAALRRNRKRIAAGGQAGTIGFNKKKGG